MVDMIQGIDWSGESKDHLNHPGAYLKLSHHWKKIWLERVPQVFFGSNRIAQSHDI